MLAIGKWNRSIPRTQRVIFEDADKLKRASFETHQGFYSIS